MDATVKHLPAVVWMPLGLARLRPMPTAFTLGLPERKHLWSWMGSTSGKPERAEMLEALDAHSRAAEIKAMGFLQPFLWYAGVNGQPDAMGIMEYTLLMHQTQFVPIPAGNSPEQFRLWEAFEAGEGAGQRLPCMCHAARPWSWLLIIGCNCSTGICPATCGLWEPAALGLSLLALGRLPAHPAGADHGAGWGALPVEGAGL